MHELVLNPDLWGSRMSLRLLFLFCMDYYVSLKLRWVSALVNPADAPSRVLKRSDVALSARLRQQLWTSFGPFSFDLLALPSNVFRDPSGKALPFFSLFPVASSSGANVFVQPPPSGVLYAFPPFVILVPLINLFVEWGYVDVVLVLPSFLRRRPAWLTLASLCRGLSCLVLGLCCRGDWPSFFARFLSESSSSWFWSHGVSLLLSFPSSFVSACSSATLSRCHCF